MDPGVSCCPIRAPGAADTGPLPTGFHVTKCPSESRRAPGEAEESSSGTPEEDGGHRQKKPTAPDSVTFGGKQFLLTLPGQEVGDGGGRCISMIGAWGTSCGRSSSALSEDMAFIRQFLS